MTKKKIIKQYKDSYEGKEITVSILESKNKKRTRTAKRTKTTCPNCMSTMKLDKSNIWVCSGDKLKIWEKEFLRYYRYDEKAKKRYLMNLTDSGRFLELYDRWLYSQKHKDDEFNCGYSNKIYPPLNSAKIKIPDPIFCKIVEKKLGRTLTEEEIYGETDLWTFNGRVLSKYRKKAERLKIPFVLFPDEV